MGYHHCPIEPNDWTDGPDYLEGADCDTCGGCGWIPSKPIISAYSEHGDVEREPCPQCHGAGFIDNRDIDPGFDAFCQEENEL